MPRPRFLFIVLTWDFDTRSRPTAIRRVRGNREGRGSRILLVVGGALLLALAGTWMLGCQAPQLVWSR